MAHSGIKCSEECIAKYTELKMKKNIKFFVIKLEAGSKDHGTLDQFVIEKTRQLDASNYSTKSHLSDEDMEAEKGYFDEFEKHLREFASNDCRFAIYDLCYRSKAEQTAKNKILFLHWSPDDNCTIKKKMVYSSSVENLKKAVANEATKVQLNDWEDLDYQNVVETAMKHDRN